MRTPILLAATLAALIATPAEAQRQDLAPTTGQVAPDFELARLGADGQPTEETVKLSSFKGVKPVALVFGSYT